MTTDEAKALIPKELFQWLKDEGWEYLYNENFGNMYKEHYAHHSNNDTVRFGINVYERTSSVVVWLYYPADDQYLKFEPDELQLFDKLGLELTETHSKRTGQSITDWF